MANMISSAPLEAFNLLDPDRAADPFVQEKSILVTMGPFGGCPHKNGLTLFGVEMGAPDFWKLPNRFT